MSTRSQGQEREGSKETVSQPQETGCARPQPAHGLTEAAGCGRKSTPQATTSCAQPPGPKGKARRRRSQSVGKPGRWARHTDLPKGLQCACRSMVRRFCYKFCFASKLFFYLISFPGVRFASKRKETGVNSLLSASFRSQFSFLQLYHVH